MKKAYWVAQVTVNNPDPYALYAKGASEAFEKYGGRPLARGGQTIFLEGTGQARNVIIEFNSVEDALTCYNSNEYQTARRFRLDQAEAMLMIVEGL